MDYYDALDKFFSKHAPDKRANVGRLLLQYRDRELELFDKVEDKYGASVLPKRDFTPCSPRSPRRRLSGGNIFDRLTDTSAYTGAHKHRFDHRGQGLGLAGRDYTPKGLGKVPVLNFPGNTNHKSDTIFRDSSQFLVRA